jgi:5'-nucleotidase
MKKSLLILAAGLVGTWSWSCSHSPSRVARDPSAATGAYSLLAITDFHGALESDTAIVGDRQTVTFGGAEALSAYIHRLRGALGPSLLVDGGDLFQGTMLSNSYEGAPVIRFYNELGVDAAALGNHEFDFGPAGEKAIPMTSADDAQGALKERVREAHFPFLAANVRDPKQKLPDWVKPSIVKEVNGVRVGVIGVSDPHTPSTTNALNLVGLEFLDATSTAALITAEARRLREEEGVRSIVLTSHIGAICRDNSLERIDDLSSCDATDIFQILKMIPAGTVDAVVAGHTHRQVIKRVNGALVLQSGSSGKYVGWAKVEVREGAPNTVIFGGMVPVCVTVLRGQGFESCDSYELKGKSGVIAKASFLGSDVAPDSSVTKLYEKELAEIAEKKNAPVGNVSLDREFTRSYNGESVLGNLVADLQLAMHPSADIGMTNGGGLRNNLPQGQLIYNHIFRLMPFDNQLAIVKVTPPQLEALIRSGASGKSGAYVFSKNVRFELKKCLPQNIRVNDRPLAEFAADHVFRVAMSDFLAGGGSGVREVGLPPDAAEILWSREYILRDAMVRVLKSWNRPLKASEFMDPARPRQVILEACPAPASSGK